MEFIMAKPRGLMTKTGMDVRICAFVYRVLKENEYISDNDFSVWFHTKGKYKYEFGNKEHRFTEDYLEISFAKGCSYYIYSNDETVIDAFRKYISEH